MGENETRTSHLSSEDTRTLSVLHKESLLVFLGMSEILALSHHQSNIGRSCMPSAKKKMEMLESYGIKLYTILLIGHFWLNLGYKC